MFIKCTELLKGTGLSSFPTTHSGFREQVPCMGIVSGLWDYLYSHSPFESGSRFPHAGSVRICTCARFKLLDEDRGTEFVILNTHLDNSSDHQRRLGASLLLYRAKYEALRPECPVFVMGDFNRYEGIYYQHRIWASMAIFLVLQKMNMIQVLTKLLPAQWSRASWMRNSLSDILSRKDNSQTSIWPISVVPRNRWISVATSLHSPTSQTRRTLIIKRVGLTSYLETIKVVGEYFDFTPSLSLS